MGAEAKLAHDFMDTDGTDGGDGSGETAEYFFEMFTALSIAAGVQVPASLLEACADAVDEYVEDMAEFMEDEDGYSRRWLRDLPRTGSRTCLTVIAGGEAALRAAHGPPKRDGQDD